MTTRALPPLALAMSLALAAGPARAVPGLFDFAINVDGATTCHLGACDVAGATDFSAAPGVDDSGFSFVTGLGAITVAVSGAGPHNVDLFLDHEFFAPGVNPFTDEFGAREGTPVAGQSWEIDEPGFLFGDIFSRFLASDLENDNALPAGMDDDVSMAMGFDFGLADGETALVEFLLSSVAPAAGFFMSHTDVFSEESLYFSGSLEIRAVPPGAVPEPGTLLLLGLALAGLGAIGAARRRTRR